MKETDYGAKSVIVGIDGSEAAIDAAKWAVEEAINRDIPLRLVYVNRLTGRHGSTDNEFLRNLEEAESALYHAQCAIQAVGKPVKVETAVLRGEPDEVLIEESLDAALICVGSVGKGRTPTTMVGPAAAALIKRAHCSVAIIRRGTASAEPGWIAAVLNDEPDNDAVVHRIMHEGRLRQAPVLLIDRRVDSWVRRFPDVHVQISATFPGRTRTLEKCAQRLDLVVVGSSDADQVARLVTADCHPDFGCPNCSALLVRG